jgi:predicted DNA-binding transcriptional regulator AlpA
MPARAKHDHIDRTNDVIVSTKQVCAMINKHRSTVQRRLKNDPRFPRPVPSSLGANEFWLSDIQTYLALPKHP